MRMIYILLLVSFLFNNLLFSSENVRSKNELVSAYIYLLSKNTFWPHEKKIKKFKIAIMEDGFKLYDTFKKMSQDLHLKNKEIQIIHIGSKEDIDYKDIQVIFLDKNFRDELKSIYNSIGPRAILIISEGSKDLKYSMINLYEDKKYRLNIELNLNNIQIHGLDINNQIILSGASKVGIGKLYHSSIDAMKKQEERFKKYQQLNIKLKNSLKKYETKIETLNKNIADKVAKYNKTIKDIRKKEFVIGEKERLLKKKEHSIKLKELKIKELQQNLKQLKEKLSIHKDTLDEKIKDIQKQKKILKRYLKTLDEKLSEIKELDKQIKYQEQMIKRNKDIRKEQEAEIQQQKTSLYLIGVIAVLLLLFAIYFYTNKLKYQKINEKLRIAKNEAIYANKAKSIFISKMSHELRTPLNAILGFSDMLLQNSTISKNDKKSLKIINTSGSFLLKLINDILDISSIESHEVVLHENAVNMKNILNDVVALVQNNVDAKLLKLDVNYEHNGIDCIKIDDKLVRQILVNLLTNAIKYSNKGVVSIHIKIDKKFLFMRVSDEGIGIDKDDLKYIFEPFKQVGEASSSTGSGLGLAIVKQFVEIMKGEISVKSILDKGSTFDIKVPYKKCTKDEKTKLNSDDSLKKVLGVSKDSESLKILIVEDKQNNILLLKNILSVLNFDIRIVENGQDAVDEFKTFKPDLIFMDKRMPKMDGLEAVKIIRNLENGDDVKIVMLSANAFAKKPSENFVDAFIFKPYKAKEIYEIISKYFDVKYIYEEEIDTKKDSKNIAFSHQKFKEYLQSLDSKLLDELFNGAVLLNSDDMDEVMQKISLINKELYEMLEQLVVDINFLEILNTINEIKEDK